jgi:hypothetical protein
MKLSTCEAERIVIKAEGKKTHQDGGAFDWAEAE